MSIKKGSIVAGKYRLEKGLAQGGMGAVWVARQIQLDRLVAIKFMDAALAEAADGRTRFEREAKASAQIQSPHVVQVHDYGIEDGIPYLVMELLTGEDLAARLRRQRKITLRETTSILVPVTKALRKAHEAGIIHRDLKPANIYISRQDDDEIIKVLDFGIAKVSGPGKAHEATATGVLVGSVHYMSPEQARGFKQIDGRSDLWSLGVIAFRALTGRVPFPGDQLGDVIVRICSDPIPIASELAPELPPEVDRFFEKALARSPNDRFQTATEWGAAIAALCDAVGAAAPTSQPGSTPWPTGTYPSAIAAGVVKPGERPGASSGTLPSAIAPSSGPPPPPPESASAGAAERTSAATPLSRSLKVGTAPSGSTAAPSGSTAAPTAPSAQAAQAAPSGSAAAQNAPSAVATTPSAVPIVPPPRSTRAPSPSFPGIPPPPPSAPRKPSPSIPMITATPQAAPASKPRSTPAPRAASAESTEEEAPSSVRIPTFEPIAAAPVPDPTSHRTPRPVSAPGGAAAPASSSLLTPPPASPPLFTPPPASASSRTPFPAPPSSGPPAPSSGPNLTPPPASASLFTPAPASASIITPGPIATPAGAPSSPPSGMPSSSEGPAASELSDLSDDDLKSFRQKSGWAARKRSIAIGAIAVIVGGGILIRLMSGGSDPSADQASSSEQIAAPATQPPPAPTPSLTGSAGPAPTTSTSAAPGPSSSGSADPDKRRKPPGYVKPRVNETLGI